MALETNYRTSLTRRSSARTLRQCGTIFAPYLKDSLAERSKAVAQGAIP